MKGVLLCGGSGTRLQPVTYTVPKQLIPAANVPVVQYIIEKMVQSDVRDIAMIVGECAECFEKYFGDGRDFGCKLKYYRQEKPNGLAAAILCAKDFIDEDFVLILGDNYFDFSLEGYIKEFREKESEALLLTKRVDNPSEFGIAMFKGDRIVRIVEKPKITDSNIAVVGIYIFSPAIIDAAGNIKPSKRGEYEITDAIQYLIDKGSTVISKECCGTWMDIGRPKDVLEFNRYILGKCDEKNNVGKGTEIEGSAIGSYVSIGRDCRIKNSIICNSVIMDECIIEGVRIYGSIVCSGSIIKGHGSISGIFAAKSRVCVG